MSFFEDLLKLEEEEKKEKRKERKRKKKETVGYPMAVSYTHLTLPTN